METKNIFWGMNKNGRDKKMVVANFEKNLKI
jgi:hypothetical protein